MNNLNDKVIIITGGNGLIGNGSTSIGAGGNSIGTTISFGGFVPLISNTTFLGLYTFLTFSSFIS